MAQTELERISKSIKPRKLATDSNNSSDIQTADSDTASSVGAVGDISDASDMVDVVGDSDTSKDDLLKKYL